MNTVDPVRGYYTLASLTGEALKDWAKISKETPGSNFKLHPPKKEIEHAFRLYESSFKSALNLMVLGDQGIRSDETLIKNFGTVATDPQVDRKKIKAFLQTTYKLEPGKALDNLVEQLTKKGSILNESNWWIFLNDLFMLGAIHRASPFYLAFNKIPSDELLWDAKNNRLRVLGREILMLKLAGYKLVYCQASMGLVLDVVPGNNLISLTETRKAVETCTLQTLKDFFSKVYLDSCAGRELSEKEIKEMKLASRKKIPAPILLLPIDPGPLVHPLQPTNRALEERTQEVFDQTLRPSSGKEEEKENTPPN